MSQAKTITPDELERLHRRLGSTRNALRNQTMLHLMHWAGMRVGEVAALRIKDLINRDGTLKTEIHLGAAQTTRVRHQMTQVVDSYRASLKLATTKGSTGRLGSVF